MKRAENPPQPDPTAAVAQLFATGDGSPDLNQKLEIIRNLVQLPETSRDVALLDILRAIDRQIYSLRRAGDLTRELRLKIDELIGRLWHPAIFLAHVAAPADRRGYVQIGTAERIVGIIAEVPLDSLSKGKEVLLNPTQSAIVAVSTRGIPRVLDIATVAEITRHHTVFIRRQEEEIELELADGVAIGDLAAGDRIRYSRNACLVYGKVEKTAKPRFLLSETPTTQLAEVGGQDENLEKLLNTLGIGLLAPELAEAYGISARCSVLLTGPPGCGKTLLVRAAVAEVARISGRTAKIFIVRPGELQHWLVGSSELAVRQLFQDMREAADDKSLVVLFLDEVESLARIRGHQQGFYSDQLLNALLAEIDGFTSRTGVAIVATTNRKDLLDSSMAQRLSDQELAVRPPDMIGARAILNIHMREQFPYNPNGQLASSTRREVIETALVLLFGPTSPYAQLLRLKFRDATTRVLAARDFISGRLLEQICRFSRQGALHRQHRDGAPGVRVSDMEDAVADAMEKVASAVTIFNVRNQVADLPTDLDVVAVERIARKVARPHRYLNPVLS